MYLHRHRRVGMTIALLIALLLIMPKAFSSNPAVSPTLTWLDDSKENYAVLLCIHGLGLYSKSFEAFGKRMSSMGVPTYAIDMRGFGRWQHSEEHKKIDFDESLNDIKDTLKRIHKCHPGLPVFILGESMGGAIALRATALYPDLIDGLVSSVPSADRFQQKRTAMRVAWHLLADPDKPFDVVHKVLDQATDKEELKKSVEADPLDRLTMSARELLKFQLFMSKNHNYARQIKSKPVLIVQGCKDRLVRPDSTIEIYNQLGTLDRQLVLIPKAEHFIFEEAQFNNQIIEILNTWIKTHLPGYNEPLNVSNL